MKSSGALVPKPFDSLELAEKLSSLARGGITHQSVREEGDALVADDTEERMLLGLNGDRQLLSFRAFWGCQQSCGDGAVMDGAPLRA